MPKPQYKLALHPLALGLCLALPGARPALAGPPAAAPSAPGRLPADCTDGGFAARLKAREVAALGSKHAEEHAQARQYRCRLLQGLQPDEQAPARVAADALPPAQGGRWSAPFTIPVAAVSSVLLNNGSLLFWSYDPAHWGDPNTSNIGVSYLWNPATGAGQSIPAPENFWCGGQTILADGRVFIAGGNLRFPDPNAPPGQGGWEGDASTYIYNPGSTGFIKQPEMRSGRWYPTVTQLPDNTALITSGYDETGSETVNQLVERFVPSAARNGVGTISVVSAKNPYGLFGVYPYQYVLPSGKMLQSGPESWTSALLDPATWSWTGLPHMLHQHYGQANGITYIDASRAPVSQIVMVAGNIAGPSDNEWLDAFNPAAGWRDYPKWQQWRHNANTVILPDGKLLTVGGNSASDNYTNPAFSAELYSKPANDRSGVWTVVEPSSLRAAYHSSAILLPDARVLLSEDDRTKTVEAAANHKYQIYSPPYLFKGARPGLAAPATLPRGTDFRITATPASGRTIASAVLIAPGAVTHGNDMHQRLIRLPLRSTSTGLLASVPASRALVPPGYYLLFIVDSAGVPSIAKFVNVP
jgi:hypothetical protein